MESANEISSSTDVVRIKEEIDDNCVLQEGNVFEGEEAMKKYDECSTLRKPENINNMHYSSGLNEKHHVTEIFLNRVKMENGFNLTAEEIQIKDEDSLEATDSDSNDISNNKLINEVTNKPDNFNDGFDSEHSSADDEKKMSKHCNLTLSEDDKNKGMDQKVDIAKRHKCDECHKAFTYPNVLKVHSCMHTGERPSFECTTCKKTFSSSFHLKRHVLTHTGEKPYECDICNKKFNVKSNLKVHKEIHTNKRPFKCSVCEKAFTKSDHLSGHMRIHTGEKPFKCSVCSKTFALCNHLSQHMRIHTGEKPFQCQFCQYKCARAAHLKTHMRMHTGEKPFTCKHCKKSFSSGLKRHMRMMHSDKI